MTEQGQERCGGSGELSEDGTYRRKDFGIGIEDAINPPAPSEVERERNEIDALTTKGLAAQSEVEGEESNVKKWEREHRNDPTPADELEVEGEDERRWTITICGKCGVLYGHRYCDKCGSSRYRQAIEVAPASLIDTLRAQNTRLRTGIEGLEREIVQSWSQSLGRFTLRPDQIRDRLRSLD